MTPQFEKVKEIFHAALDCSSGELNAFLDNSCAGDQVLRAKVEELLAAHQQADSFIETPVADLRVLESEATDSLIGRTFGHYKISKRIGRGGMGEVYLAADVTAGRNAALKLLPSRFTGDAERMKRFQQEARAVVALNHPSILTVYEIGREDSTHYIASELIEGETLRQRLRGGRIEFDEAIEIAIQVAGALAAAHRAGIIHRDIKPENIMLRPDGYVKVLDFGIAKLAQEEAPATMEKEQAVMLAETNLGLILGTVHYISPEQARGARVDKRTDIWSLGVVLYEMVTGHTPFRGDAPRKVMTSILETVSPLLSANLNHAPPELQQILSKALQKDPAQRYQSTNEMLDVLKALRRRLELKSELERSAVTRLWLRWSRSPTAVVLTLLAGALVLALPFYLLRNRAVSALPEKSIAVLPFENLSRDPDNAFFTNGVQDEILADLAKIADLKVISRTSVMLYKSDNPRNLREIGEQLGVAHVLEGSVQRAANRVRVTAQLIDARTDAHLWAQTYDRDLADVFAIQSEIAKTIADQLQAKLSPREKVAISQPPTTDLTANTLYLQAKALEFKAPQHESLLQAVDLLKEAVQRDPNFMLAYCMLGRLQIVLYWGGYDHTPARLELANTAIQNAVRLQPDAGEAHLALAWYAYQGFRDYDRARAELDLARHTLPNNADIYYVTALIDRRQGRWAEATRNLEHAIELDPRNFGILIETAFTYSGVRRYSDAMRLDERARAISPRDYFARILHGVVPYFERANIKPLRTELSAILTQEPAAAEKIADLLFRCAMAERDSVAVNRALAAIPAGGVSPGGNFIFPREWFVGVAARTFNDATTARDSFSAARVLEEKITRDQPDYAQAWSLLGRIDAALGRKEDAIREGRHACELLPLSKDAWAGAGMIESLAVIYAWPGEKDLALEQLAVSARIPNGVTYGELKLDPQWDPLRGDPRFEKIVASLAPKTVN